MFPNICCAMGLVGWLATLLVWAGTLAMAIWVITRLFPDRPSATTPSRTPDTDKPEEAPPARVESGHR